MIVQTVFVGTGVPISGTAITLITPPPPILLPTGAVGALNSALIVEVLEQGTFTGFLYIAGLGVAAGNQLSVRVGNQQTVLSQPYYITVVYFNVAGQAVAI